MVRNEQEWPWATGARRLPAGNELAKPQVVHTMRLLSYCSEPQHVSLNLGSFVAILVNVYWLEFKF